MAVIASETAGATALGRVRDDQTEPMSEDELDTWLDDAYRP